MAACCNPQESTSCAELKKQLEIQNRELMQVRQALAKEKEARQVSEEKADDADQRLRILAERIVSEEEAGCNRLARELHDGVGQKLTALKINLNLIFEQLSEHSRSLVEQRFKDSLDLTTKITKRLRETTSALRSPVLDYDGLFEALKWECDRFSNRTGIRVDLQGKEPEKRPSPEVETTLFRIAQEALTNVSKHADANTVTLKLYTSKKELRMIVADNGVGFDPDNMPRKPNSGLGFSIMRERVEAQNGMLQMYAEKDKGVQILVCIPN